MTMPPDIPTLPEGWVWTTQEVIFQRLKYSSREDLNILNILQWMISRETK